MDERLIASIRQRRHQRSYMDGLFAPQRRFVEDRSKRKAALCGRRAGKTEGLCADLLEGGWDSPGETSVYIALTRNNCRQILWATMQRLDRRHGLGLWFREQDGQLFVVMPNGHKIWLVGCKDSSEVEKFRGQRYRKAAIDEAGSFGGYLESLIEDALEPALMDMQGELILIGSPGVIPAGYFYDVTTGSNGRSRWPTYHWTVLDNPHMPHAAQWLETRKREWGWGDEHPRYRREYLGEWVRDDGALVYPYDGRRNAFTELPEGGRWHTTIGLDLGYVDSTAWVVVKTRVGDPEVYVVHASKRSGLIPSAVAAQTQRLMQDYPGALLVADVGGLGKGYAEEMRQRYGIPVQAADKRDKLGAAEMLRGDILSGVVRVDPYACAPLLDEWQRLQWNEDHTGFDERFEDHCADAALYAYRHCRPVYRPEVEPDMSPDAQAARYRLLVQKRVRKRLRDAGKW